MANGNELLQLEELLKKLHNFGLLTGEEEKKYPELVFKIEQELNTKTPYFEFIEKFNKLMGTRYKGDPKGRQIFYESAESFSVNERITAVNKALQDEWVQNNPDFVNPFNFSKFKIVNKYVNQSDKRQSNSNNNGEDKENKGKTKKSASEEYNDLQIPGAS